MKGFDRIKLVVSFLFIALLLSGCGNDATTAPTIAPTVAVPTAAATVQPTTVPATTVPATTVPATTVPVTTAVAATTAPATTAPATTTAVTTAPPISTAAATTAAMTTGASSSGQSNLTVVDRSGTTITLAKNAERVVCLSRDCVDFLAELGIEPVALSKDLLDLAVNPKMFGDKAKTFPLVGGNLFEPNLEDITKAKPDLIIGYDMLHSMLREPLKNVAPMYLGFAKTPDEALANFKAIGGLLGKSSAANASIAKFQARLAAYKAKAPNDKSGVYFASSDGQVFLVSTDQTLPCKLIAEIGKCSATLPQNPGQYGAFGIAQFSLEQLVALNPQNIFIPARADLIQPEQLKGNKLWEEITAVKTQQIHSVAGEIWDNNGGIRAMNQILDDIATQLYPSLFPKPLE